jgi:hypothetical protein
VPAGNRFQNRDGWHILGYPLMINNEQESGMSKSEHLGAYAEAWTTGNAEKLMECLADDYVMDDPNHGQVAKGQMKEYFEGMKATVADMRGGELGDVLLELSEVLTGEEGDELTAWAWWSAPGTPFVGGGLIKVADRGVVSERLTYYTKLPE